MKPSSEQYNTDPSHAQNSSGIVYLIGAGPGDPGLLTIRAKEYLSRADLVLYDGLVNPLILVHCSGNAERTSRAPEGVEGRIHQEELNHRLIEAAREGKTVVRLKGGDPFIFGRGGEEALALEEAGIPYEVVPGVTAAVAASAYAGISLTQRGMASAVAWITGHEDPSKPDLSIDYAVLAKFPGTLVFYMGLHRLTQIVQSLIEQGLPESTLSCVISRGTRPNQRTVVAPLRELPQRVLEAGLRPPSLIVIGEVVSLREKLTWFESRPLFGQRIGVTRPETHLEASLETLFEFGAEGIEIPTISLNPPTNWTEVDAAWHRIREYSWMIFTSAHGVRYFLNRLFELGSDLRKLGGVKLAAIGPATAEELRKYHLVPDLIPDEYRGEALSDCLMEQIQRNPSTEVARVLWPRASRGRNVIPERLEAAGIRVDQVVTYEHTDLSEWSPEVRQEVVSGSLDWICLTSPAIASSFARLLGDQTEVLDRGNKEKPRSKIAVISPVTQAAAEAAGLRVDCVAKEYTWRGVIEAISEWSAPGN